MLEELLPNAIPCHIKFLSHGEVLWWYYKAGDILQAPWSSETLSILLNYHRVYLCHHCMISVELSSSSTLAYCQDKVYKWKMVYELVLNSLMRTDVGQTSWVASPASSLPFIFMQAKARPWSILLLLSLGLLVPSYLAKLLLSLLQQKDFQTFTLYYLKVMNSFWKLLGSIIYLFCLFFSWQMSHLCTPLWQLICGSLVLLFKSLFSL